jgi:tetrahydromethanopterin S-methyltransferase subunit E
MSDNHGATGYIGDEAEDTGLDTLSLWTAWLHEASGTGSEIAGLFQLELKLALANLGRMILLAISVLPLVLILWIGATATIAWAVYEMTDVAVSAFIAFTLIQLAALLSIAIAWNAYRKRLTLPMTRKQLHMFMRGGSLETPTADP